MLKSLFSSSITIPTLRLSGIIGQTGFLRSGLSIATLDKLIDKLFADKKSPAVALIINSPGGSPTQSSLIAEKIIKKSQEKNKKVITFVEDVAASGGYWLACAGDEIYVDTNSILGSIGVISPGFGFVELIKKKENLRSLPKPIKIDVKFFKRSKNDVPHITVKTKQGTVFGPQPFLAIQTKSKRFIHDNFDF